MAIAIQTMAEKTMQTARAMERNVRSPADRVSTGVISRPERGSGASISMSVRHPRSGRRRSIHLMLLVGIVLGYMGLAVYWLMMGVL